MCCYKAGFIAVSFFYIFACATSSKFCNYLNYINFILVAYFLHLLRNLFDFTSQFNGRRL